MDAFAWPIAAIVLGISFLTLFRPQIRDLINRITRVSRKGIDTPEHPQLSSPEDASTALEEFMDSFANPLLLDQERTVNADLEKRGLSDPVAARAALARTLAGSQILLHFERAHNTLWGSQTALLTALNGRPDGVTPEEAQVFYETGKSDFPQMYTEYAFDAWLGFLLSTLFVDDEGERLKITLAGREFLKWRLDGGRVGPDVG